MFANTSLEYSVLLIKSIGKKSFEALGKVAQKSGSTISRLLPSAAHNFDLMAAIAVEFFKHKKELIFVIDDTLIKKMHSRFMRGSGRFYDTKLGRKVLAYKLMCCAITDGKYLLPLGCAFLFDKELLSEPIQSKDDLVKEMILYAIKLFPDKNIIVAADGAFASREILGWCIENKISVEMRMHSNRKIMYKGQYVVIRDIPELRPKGRHMARTIQAVWHGMTLDITAQRRINKHGEETIIYQVATYRAKPSKHVAVYKRRWPIEKLFRTAKQHLGLEDCFSIKTHIEQPYT